VFVKYEFDSRHLHYSPSPSSGRGFFFARNRAIMREIRVLLRNAGRYWILQNTYKCAGEVINQQEVNNG
ncbi:MAG: hypothetical protein Q4P36_05335, partial [Bowdeniella nasicola]|nr:hypothetical protein [Bowdeniella nasicola]